MGDLPVHNFDIKSIFRNYQVEFIDNSPAVLKDEIKNGDVIIMDQRLKALHPLIIESIPENILCIDIEAHEKNKNTICVHDIYIKILFISINVPL